MKGEAGKLVETKTGKTGILKNGFQPVNGKVPVHLVDADFNPILNEKNKPTVILCDPKTLTLKGFVN